MHSVSFIHSYLMHTATHRQVGAEKVFVDVHFYTKGMKTLYEGPKFNSIFILFVKEHNLYHKEPETSSWVLSGLIKKQCQAETFFEHFYFKDQKKFKRSCNKHGSKTPYTYASGLV